MPCVMTRQMQTEKAAEIGKIISVKEHKRIHHDFDTKMFYENRFWNLRPDGIVINKNHPTLYILESNCHLTEMRIFWG